MKTRHKLIAKTYDKKGRLISEATNNYNKSHPLQAYFAARVGHPSRIYLHAEIHAIIKAGDKKIHRLEITRIGKNNKPLNAKPCPICQEAIKAYGIKFVSFTTGE
jgi:tRNA(Arg) A34 adenosine deaminase TadA